MQKQPTANQTAQDDDRVGNQLREIADGDTTVQARIQKVREEGATAISADVLIGAAEQSEKYGAALALEAERIGSDDDYWNLVATDLHENGVNSNYATLLMLNPEMDGFSMDQYVRGAFSAGNVNDALRTMVVDSAVGKANVAVDLAEIAYSYAIEGYEAKTTVLRDDYSVGEVYSALTGDIAGLSISETNRAARLMYVSGRMKPHHVRPVVEHRISTDITDTLAIHPAIATFEAVVGIGLAMTTIEESVEGIKKSLSNIDPTQQSLSNKAVREIFATAIDKTMAVTAKLEDVVKSKLLKLKGGKRFKDLISSKGMVGEWVAETIFEQSGMFQKVTGWNEPGIRNKNDWGLDIMLQEKSGAWTGIEVKTTESKFLRLSNDQNKGAKSYIDLQLGRAKGGFGHWRHTEAGVSELAADILDYSQVSGGVKGHVLQISQYGTKDPNTYWLPWKKGINSQWQTYKGKY